MAGENINQVRVGPGWLYVGNITAAEPADGDLTTPWATVDASWIGVGFTDEGHEVTHSPSFEGIEVAERKLPIRYEKAGGELTLSFSMAQVVARTLTYAFNGGTVVVTGTGASTVKTFEPPADDVTPTEIKIGWEAFDGKERYIFRRCLQTGDVTIGRKKAPDKTVIPVTFRCMEPTAGGRPFKWIIAEPA